VRNHLLPDLGRRRLGDITFEDVERLTDRKSDRLSPDTRLRVVLTLGYVLKLARKRRLISHNPISDADKPSPRRRKPELPTLDELTRLSDAMRTPETRAFVFVAAFTGLRKSELFGLKWKDIDLTPNAERVRVTRQWYKGKLVEPKTKASSREVVVPRQAADVLRELSVAVQVDDRPNPLGLVFPSPTGRHWLDTNFDRRVWRPAREAAGLPCLTVHTLRYFYVSYVRASGLPAAITEQLVGHVDERTHRGYSVPIPGTETLIRTGLERAFGGRRGADA
jgi:integrase